MFVWMVVCPDINWRPLQVDPAFAQCQQGSAPACAPKHAFCRTLTNLPLSTLSLCLCIQKLRKKFCHLAMLKLSFTSQMTSLSGLNTLKVEQHRMRRLDSLSTTNIIQLHSKRKHVTRNVQWFLYSPWTTSTKSVMAKKNILILNRPRGEVNKTTAVNVPKRSKTSLIVWKALLMLSDTTHNQQSRRGGEGARERGGDIGHKCIFLLQSTRRREDCLSELQQWRKY